MTQDQLGRFRVRLVQAIEEHREAVQPPPLAISPWIAMSMLQKSIRRSKTATALRAASTLLSVAPDRLWRRLGGAAFEDVGLGSMGAIGLTTVALSGKRFRASLGGDWAVASTTVKTLCVAPKSRASDDLFMALETLPKLRGKRKEYAAFSDQDLQSIVLNANCLETRALAFLYLLGIRRPCGLSARRGEPSRAFDLLDEMGVAATLIAVCREGHKKTGELLPPLIAMLALHDGLRDGASEDEIPRENWVGEVPCWASDMFTREGRSALARLLKTNAGVAELVRARVHEPLRLNFVGQLLFRVEGGVLKRRTRGVLADRLHTQFLYNTLGVEPSCAAEALGLMREALPLLDQIRADVLNSRGNDAR